MAASVRTVPVLGEYTLDTVRGCLLCAGRPVHLRPLGLQDAGLLRRAPGTAAEQGRAHRQGMGRPGCDGRLDRAVSPRHPPGAWGRRRAVHTHGARPRLYLRFRRARTLRGRTSRTPVAQVPTDEASFQPLDRSSHGRSTRLAALMTLAAIAAISLLLAGVWRLSYVGASGVHGAHVSQAHVVPGPRLMAEPFPRRRVARLQRYEVVGDHR